MTKLKAIFVCDNCGNEFPKWSGRCPSCGEWNTVKEVAGNRFQASGTTKRKSAAIPEKLSTVRNAALLRTSSGISEFDRVLGGGFVPGSIILLGGDPGIGKSTLILKVAARIKNTLYVSGEESLSQIKIRANRLKIDEEILMLPETDLETIIATIEKLRPKLSIIDSIQTTQDENIVSTPGSVSQVKGCALRLQMLAKKSGVPIVLIGHVTKEGAVAGPKTLEHLVDTVLYLEGDKYSGQRILRASKNRFGSTGETAVFEMREGGMIPVANPSSIFLEKTGKNIYGSAVTAAMEGSKVFMLEVQALTSRIGFGYPKRVASGVDQNRLNLIAAVLSERARMNLQEYDIYVNILGGIKVREPAVDLAVALSIASSKKKESLPKDSFFLGELALSGEIREVSQLERRIQEGAKLGFKTVFVPATTKRLVSAKIKIVSVKNISELISRAL